MPAAKRLTTEAVAVKTPRKRRARPANEPTTPAAVYPPAWSTACLDWKERIKEGRSLIPFAPLFPEAAAQALAIFKKLVVVDVVGSPTMGECGRDWLFDLVNAVFGCYDSSTGVRLISEFFLLISKKNTKSTSAAGIMLTALILNWRLSGEYYILAPTKEVAGNAYKPLADAIAADDELKAIFEVQDHIKTVTHKVTKATLKVVAADSETVGGKKGIGVLVDELWLFGMNPKAQKMFVEALGGMASRDEAFTIWLSTQSDDPPAGVFLEKLEYARNVRDGKVVDPKFLPILYEFPPEMIANEEHLKPENFYITNPNLGASVSESFLTREYTKALGAGKATLAVFLAKHLNVQITVAQSGGSWSGIMFWEKRHDTTLKDLTCLVNRCDVITAGIDGGGLDDLLGFAAIGREAETKEWLSFGYGWALQAALDRRKSEITKFEDFQKRGEMTIVETLGQDIDELIEMILLLEDSGLLDRIGVDPAGIGTIVDAIIETEIEPDRIVGIPQGWKLTGSIKTVERKLADGSFKHNGSTFMNYNVSNAKTEPRGNATLITKQISGAAKIDALMATFNAAALMAMNPTPRKKQYQMMVFG